MLRLTFTLGRFDDPCTDESAAVDVRPGREVHLEIYLDLPDGPQFPFGHGPSYTDFAAGQPRPDRDTVTAEALERGERVGVEVEVADTGDRAGDEVVQLYVHDPVASITQPVRRLRGFARVTLGAGEKRTVRFTLGAEDLGFWTNDAAGRHVVEPGRIDVYAGTSSLTEARCTLTIA